MLTKVLTKVFGTQHEREMKRLQPVIDRINQLEPGFKNLTNDQLKGKTAEFRQRLANGEELDSILPEAFATTREASMRVLGMRHYDVQLIGGLVLHRGSIAEMKTGEGKTLVATLPMYLHGLSQKGAHLVTVNDYLAQRDCEWMGRLYKFLGLTTGTIIHDLDDQERKAAYGADITYGTNNEFGFDYLRDNMKFRIEDYVQRGHNFAIVDECDSILIDEARTPLIISGPSEDSTTKYYEINKIIPRLQKDVHFTMEEKSRTASLTEEGNAEVEKLLGLSNLYDPENIAIVHHVYQALKAHYLYTVDVDYMIKDGEIVIVDEFTGRLMPGRRWSDGLHQAVEAKEGVKIRSENQTLATITFQNYFRMYNRLSGMTGTAETEAVEMHKIYNLDVVVIPTNRPIQRADHDDIVYKSEKAKFKAIVEDIKTRQEKGQPVLVGTVSIERSERISRALKNEGVTHNVLNAKHHEREAEIVAQAGRKGGVTIATNMAGRGTDIVLGGNAEFMAKAAVQGNVDSPEYESQLKKFREHCASEREHVVSAGGLYIIGTERHEARRIDNQLRGRSGRQGDPGESRFYLSLEDDLMRKFNGERIQWIMGKLNVPEDEPIMAGMVSRAIEGAQKKVEGYNFDIRKHLLEFDDVMNQQRNAIYSMRRNILSGGDIDRVVLDFLENITSSILDTFVPEESQPKDWDLHGMATALGQFGVHFDTGATFSGPEQVAQKVAELVKEKFDRQKAHLGQFFAHIQKSILLQTIDEKWKEHLAGIDQLREGINLRAYAQKDPLIEYKKEAFRMFETMNASIESEIIQTLLKVQVVAEERARQQLANRERARAEQELSYSGAEEADAGGGGYLHHGGPLPGLGSQPPQRQSLQYGDGQDEGPKLNRAERRRREKMAKKGRVR